jgi:hypothetical protein
VKEIVRQDAKIPLYANSIGIIRLIMHVNYLMKFVRVHILLQEVHSQLMSRCKIKLHSLKQNLIPIAPIKPLTRHANLLSPSKFRTGALVNALGLQQLETHATLITAVIILMPSNRKPALSALIHIPKISRAPALLSKPKLEN